MTQLQKARALAAAFKRLDRARAELAKAETTVSALVGPVIAKRSLTREQVREALELTGLLEG